jgi:hypothetical protein
MPSSNHQFLISLPGAWQVGTIHVFQGPEEEGLSHQILLQIDDKPDSNDLEAYARPRIDARIAAQPDFETLQDEAISLPDGSPAHAWVAKFASSGDQVYFQRHLYLVRNGRAFTLSGTFTKKTFKTLGADMLAMAGSLRAGK